MAIHCTDLNKMGTIVTEMLNVTTTVGRPLVVNFGSQIETLSADWQGSDATKNLKDLEYVYNEVAKLVTTVEKFIIDVNDNEIYPLQQHVMALGGEVTSMVSKIDSVPAGFDSLNIQFSETVYTADAIEYDASTFAALPSKLTEFVDSLLELKEQLMNVWIDGAGRESVASVFTALSENVGQYVDQLNVVKDNLNVVVQVKKNLL